VQWTYTDWSMQDLYWHQEDWLWWKRNTCLVHSAIVQEYYAKDTMFYQLVYQKSSQHQELKYTAHDARMFIFQDKSSSILMALTLEQVSHIFSLSNFQNSYLKVLRNLYQRSTDSKFSAWEVPNTSWNLTTKENQSTKMK